MKLTSARPKWVIWLTTIAVVVLGLSVWCLASQPETVEAKSNTVTLRGGDSLTIKPKNCKLVVPSATNSQVHVECDANTATPTLTRTATRTPTKTATATATRTPTATATHSPDVTFLSYISQPGDGIGGGQTHSYTSNDLTFGATLSPDKRTVSISAVNFSVDTWWYLDMAAPQGSELGAGDYENATRYPFQDSSVPGLSFYGDGRGCNTLTGRFHVLEAVYSDAGDVERFHATFEQHCEGGTAALFGEVQIVNPSSTSLSASALATPSPELINNARVSQMQADADAQDNASEKVSTSGSTLTLTKNQKVTVKPSICALQVKQATPNKVVIFCKGPTPTPTTKVTGPNGQWQGTTDQGYLVKFNVSNNNESKFGFGFSFGKCQDGLIANWSNPIQNGKFQIKGTLPPPYTGSVVFNGKFTSNTAVTGNYSYNGVSYPNCGGTSTQTGNWSAHWVNIHPWRQQDGLQLGKGLGPLQNLLQQ